jgi:hypothetical protein
MCRILTISAAVFVAYVAAVGTLEYRGGQWFGSVSHAFGQTPAQNPTNKPGEPGLKTEANEDIPTTPGTAVTMAKNAFEYRDFKKVINLLTPWVHPPRIADPQQMADARRLLGISHHILGNIEQAKEEFAQLIVVAPETELDPFVVPPAVIQSFELIKKTVVVKKPTRTPETPVKTVIKSVVRIHPSVSLLPFGYAQLFTMKDQRAWGLTWFGTQAVGLLMNVAGYWAAENTRTPSGIPSSEKAQFDTHVVTMYAGAALWSVGYLGSVIQGYGALSDAQSAITGRVMPTTAETNQESFSPSIKLSLPFH